jgi:SAM-dependent methyltransferase
MIRYFDRKNNRLVYIGACADKEMWELRWKAEDIGPIIFVKKLDATDKMVIEMTQKYLLKGARILEGGCGLGRYVNLLDTFGYQVMGVDFAEDTIQRVRNFLPKLDVRVADLRDLPFENDYFDGYWSFGVIEHFVDGYDSIACEMKRVLKSGGYLFLTVPAFSCLRQLKASLGLFPEYPSQGIAKDSFYQYAYQSLDICRSFSEYGFELITQRAFGVFKGVTDELYGTRFMMRVLCHWFEEPLEKLIGSLANHMHLFVFRK